MSNYKVSELFVYPIKSLGGISLNEAEVTDRGFKYDRRWMLIDSNGNFLSQRKIPQMALISVDIYNEKIFNSNFFFWYYALSGGCLCMEHHST